MPPLRGPIDYNRYPPRRRAAHSRTAESAENEAENAASFDERDVLSQAASTRAPRRQESATQNGEAFPQNRYETEADSSQSRDTTPRPGGNRNRARRREELLRHTAQQRGQDGVRVVSRRAAHPVAKRKLWLRRARLVLFCLMFAALGQGVYSAFTSPRMAIVEVQLDGAQITPREQLEAVQRVLVGRNWLRAPLHQAREELLALPTVRAAHVTRELSWPPRVLATIEERTPFARAGGGDIWFVVDESGVPFRRATEEDESLPAIVSPLFKPREGIAFSPRNWKAARQLVGLLSRENGDGVAGAKWNLRRVYFDRHGFASVRLRGGAQDGLLVQLGNDRWNEKLSRARRAIAYFETSGRRASGLNLVSYEMLIWTPLAVQKPRETPSQTASSGAL